MISARLIDELMKDESEEKEKGRDNNNAAG